jgi:hypothetical protein
VITPVYVADHSAFTGSHMGASLYNELFLSLRLTLSIIDYALLSFFTTIGQHRAQ